VPRTDGADMYAPVEGPDLGIDLPLVFVEQATHVLAEGGSQMRQRHEKRRIGDADRLMLSVEPRALDERQPMTLYAVMDSFFASLWREPRFDEILLRTGLDKYFPERMSASNSNPPPRRP